MSPTKRPSAVPGLRAAIQGGPPAPLDLAREDLPDPVIEPTQ